MVLELIKDTTERKPEFRQILMMHPGKHISSEENNKQVMGSVWLESH